MPAYKDEKRNTWYAMFYYTDWQGVRRRKKKRGFKRKKDAQDYERDFLNKEQRDCNITFKNLVEEYFEDMETRLKTTTISNKKFLFDSKITPYFEKMAACKITAKSIREWQNELLKMNYSPTYLKTINNQLSAVFNYAVKYYGLSSNPCRQAGSMGKKDADSMQIWTLDEFNKFISFVTKPAAHLAFEILFWTGIRSGELLALTPEDILPDKKISINKTYARLDGEDIISEPKTPKSIRIIPIPDFLYDEIWDYINRLGSIEKTDRIF